MSGVGPVVRRIVRCGAVLGGITVCQAAPQQQAPTVFVSTPSTVSGLSPLRRPGFTRRQGWKPSLTPFAPPTAGSSLNASSIFLEAPAYGSGGLDAFSVAVADVNGDGKPDLVVANQCTSSSNCNGTVGVLLGNGDGTFQTPVSYSSGGYEADSVVVEDVNGDGKPDLVVANQCTSSSNCNGTVGVLLGNGDGTFQSPVSYSTGGFDAQSVAVADVNGDGKPDLVIANRCTSSSDCSLGKVGVLLGNGDGTFPPAISYGSHGSAAAVAIADVNADGKPDVLVANYCAYSGNCNGSVGVLLGNGNGTFQTVVTYTTGGSDAYSVTVADVNGDSKPDLLVASYCANGSNCNGTVGVLLGNGDGTFQTPVSYSTGGLNAYSVAVADVNDDGKPDLLVTNDSAVSSAGIGVLGVLLGNGDGSFQTAMSYASGGEHARSVAVVDVNGDGKPDLLVANISDGNDGGGLGVLLGSGDGTFQAAPVYSSGGGSGATSVTVADVNGDGKPDLIVASFCTGGVITICPTGVVAVLPGSGDGSFPTAVVYNSGGVGASSVAVADVNGDSKPDLIVANQCISSSSCNNSSVGVLLGNGDGTFQSAVSYSLSEDSPTVAVADVNGDGKPDLIVTNDCGTTCTKGGIGVLLGNGNGTFQTAVSYSTGGLDTYAVVVADVNGDGKPDLLVGNQCTDIDCSSNGDVGVLLGNGDGTFQSAVTYGSGGQASNSLAVADVNGDGKLDLLVGNRCAISNCGSGSNGVLAVLLGNSDGSFQRPVLTNTPTINGGQLAIADFNGDGKLDVASGGSGFLLLGNGDGTFQPYVLLGAAGAIATADFNGDGSPDVAIGAVAILLNRMGGAFTTTTSVMASSSSPVYGQTVTFSATVTTSGSSAPTGSVTFSDGSNTLGTASLVNGVASLNASFATLGSHTITASYAGDTHNKGSSSGVSILVNQAMSFAGLSSAPNPSNFGQTVALTATLSAAPPGSGTPTGSVTFYDSTTMLGSSSLTGGIASVAVSTLAAGVHSLTSSYSGDSNFTSSTSGTLSQSVNLALTTTAVYANANPVIIGQSVTYTAAVGNSYGAAVTGTVTLKDGTKSLGTFTLSGGQASYTTSYTASGKHSITATYSGDSNNQASTGTWTESIESSTVTSSTRVATSGSPSLVNTLVTFTATVTSSFGSIPNGEVVTFYDGATEIGTGTTSGGVAMFSTSSLSAKSHMIKATYAGDATFNSSTGMVMQVVNPYTTTTTLLSASPNPSVYGQVVSVNAIVTTSGSTTPTGTVSFCNGASSLGTAILNSNGTATLITAKLPVGSDSLTATYQGDALNGTSTSSVVTETVTPAQIAVTLTSTPNPSKSGQSVNFTATLTSNGVLPNGQTITFSFHGTTLGTGTVGVTGVAMFSTTSLPIGRDLVTAAYAGDANHTSASASVTQTVD